MENEGPLGVIDKIKQEAKRRGDDLLKTKATSTYEQLKKQPPF